MDDTCGPKRSDFIRDIIAEDIRNATITNYVHTRFPPEPNGYLHIGHAKSICLNFGIAAEFSDALCNLRFDDTNPTKEEQEYVEAIKTDVRWLGYDWDDRMYFASDYFERFYEYAIQLIKMGRAYICELGMDDIRETRGTLTTPGIASPYRNRAPDESLDIFRRMRAGEFPNGRYVLRAKIDMSHPNIHMRDPVIYRILHASHHRTMKKWCIYPMYDYAHPLSDAIEGITHSLCTLEFEIHRPLYDWFLDVLGIQPRPRQIEFARLNLSYTVLSKRKLLELVKGRHVSGWNDPRMPTISGFRRRGYTPAAIRNFCDRIGITKYDGITDLALLEYCVRGDLNKTAQRVMGVLRPLRVVIENYPDDRVEELEAVNNPEDAAMGTRLTPFSRELYIEQEDFQEDPPKGYYRLAPGREVRLRYGYFITCNDVIRDTDGNVIELRCSYDPETRGGSAPDGRKVKGTIHWVSARHALPAEIRLYDRLFLREDPDDVADAEDYRDYLNPESLVTLPSSYVEPSLKAAKPGERYQFERQGYFCVDAVDSSPEKLVFNRTVPLRDSWAKKKGKG